ncbi:MAG: hypothetical protein AAFN92_17020, partial [Bacteroidota bacterium]
ADESSVRYSATVVGVSCNAGSDGRIDVSVSAGTAPFSFVWADGPTSEDRVDLAAGAYALTVTDATGCAVSRTYLVEEPAAIVLACMTGDVSTAADSDGLLFGQVSGGVGGPFEVTYRNLTTGVTGSQTAPDGNYRFDNLAAGEYSVTVTDSVGCAPAEACRSEIGVGTCSEDLTTAGFALEVSPPIGCDYLTGFIRFIGEQVADYRFSVDDGNTWQEDPFFPNLSARNYAPRAERIDQTGCILVSTSEVSIVSAVPIRLDPAIDLRPTSCTVPDGQLTVRVRDPQPSYRYSVDGGQTWSANPVFTGLESGAYVIVVRDSLTGCAESPLRPVLLEVRGQARLIDVATNPATGCAAEDGSIELFGTNLSEDTRVRLNDGPWQTDLTFPDLAPGVYLAELIQESTGCSFRWNAPLVVGGDDLPEMIGYVVEDVSECGRTDGSVTLNANGEGLEYTFDGRTWGPENTKNDLPAGNVAAGIRFIDNEDCILWIPGVRVEGAYVAMVDSVLGEDPTGCGGTD